MRLLEVANYMAWADRRLAADEVSATRGVAVVHGVDGPASGLLAKGPPSAIAFEVAALDAGCRRVAYATAVWVALADGVLGPPEKAALDRLAWCLGLSTEARAALEDIVWAWAGSNADWERRYAGLLQQVRAL